MTTATRRPLWLRLFYLIPIIGWAARDVDRHGEEHILWGLLAIALAWGVFFMLFGYPGLIIPALILVPTIFLYLVAVSWG